MNLQENRDRMLKLVSDWVQSWKSQKVFAQVPGIKMHTFQYWKKRQMESNTAKENGASRGFVELQTQTVCIMYFAGWLLSNKVFP